MQKKHAIYILPLIIIASLIVSIPLFLRLPMPWPDEALYIDAARNLYMHGFLGTSLYDGLVRGLEHHLFMYPPFYFLTLSSFLKIFGGGLIVARIFSQVLEICLLLVIYAVAERITKNFKVALLAVFIAAFDVLLIRSGHIARMDIETVLLNLIGIAFYVNTIESAGKTKGILLSGVFTGLAGLTHPMGIIGFIIISIHAFVTRFGIKKYLYFLIPIVVLFTFWGIYIATDPAAFAEQFLSQFKRKAGLDGANMSAVYWGVIMNAPAHFLLNIVIIPLLIYIRQKLTKDLSLLKNILLLLIIADVTAMIFPLFGAEMWYPVHLAPYLILSIVTALYCILKTSSSLLKPFVYFTLFGLILYNLIFLAGYYIKFYFKQHDSRDYFALCDRLNKAIPDGSTVFMGGEPEPFFCLEKKQDPPKMYQFMGRGVFNVDWTNIWKNSDYFILSHNGKRLFLSEDKSLNLFLKHYTLLNAIVGRPGDGYAYIIYKKK